jgi:hypothetical protein
MRRRVLVLLAACALAALGVLRVAGPAAAASPPTITYSYSGTATATCTLDVGGCLPGTTTHTTLTGLAGECVGDGCATVPSSATAEVAYDFVALPPNPCKAREVAGALTLTPTDPAYPPGPVIVNLSGRLHGHNAVILAGTIPPDTAYPPDPIRIAVTISHPPNPCTPSAGTFSGVLSVG